MRSSLIISILLFAGYSYGGPAFNDTLLIGTWKGTSICQVRPSPCNDEIAVYHVSKRDKPNSFQFIMNKMVNGVEEDMGVLDFTYDDATAILTSIDDKRKLVWTFKVKNETMEGTLVYNNVLYRVIKLTRAK